MIDISKHPNINIITNVAAKLGEIQSIIKVCTVVVSLENETAGVVTVGKKDLTDQARINVLLQVMSSLNIPFKQLKELREDGT